MQVVFIFENKNKTKLEERGGYQVTFFGLYKNFQGIFTSPFEIMKCLEKSEIFTLMSFIIINY